MLNIQTFVLDIAGFKKKINCYLDNEYKIGRCINNIQFLLLSIYMKNRNSLPSISGHQEDHSMLGLDTSPVRPLLL